MKRIFRKVIVCLLVLLMVLSNTVFADDVIVLVRSGNNSSMLTAVPPGGESLTVRNLTAIDNYLSTYDLEIVGEEIIKTHNIDELGNALSTYSNNESYSDYIDVSTGSYCKVVIYYATESTSYDYLTLKQNSATITKDSLNNTIGGANNRIGGNGNATGPRVAEAYLFSSDDFDNIEFYWRTDGSVVYYGYYANITYYEETLDYPDITELWHLEENGDGTYTLVFDNEEPMSLQTFLDDPRNVEKLGDKKDLVNKIIINNRISSIGKEAFKDWSSIKDVEFEEGCTCSKIRINAFAGCDLTSLTVPSSIGSRISSYAPSVTNVILEEPLSNYPNTIFNNANVTEVTIPDNSAIPDNFFSNATKLRQVNGKISSVGNYAFYGCTNLKNQYIDLSECTSIGNYAFQNCTGLSNINLPLCTRVGTYAFQNCTGIMNADLPVCTTVGNYAFNSCTNLQNVNLELCTSLGTYVFYNDSKLKNVNIERLTTIPDYTFYGCSQLESVQLDNIRTINQYGFYNCTKLRDLGSLDNLTSVGQYAFYNCDGLTEFVAPNVKTIGSYGFYSCNNLLNVEVSDNYKIINSYTFQECTKLRTLPLENITEIGSYALYNCNNLIIGEDDLRNVTRIYNYGLYNTYRANSTLNLESCTRLDQYAFYGSNVKEINIPNMVTLSQYALSNSNIRDIIIPASVKSMTSSYILNDDQLKSITFSYDPTSLSVANNSCGNLDSIYVDRDLTAYSTSGIFTSLGSNPVLTFGENVNNIDNVLIRDLLKANGKIVFEGPNNFKVNHRINITNNAKWNEFKGDYYVDEYGVIYELNTTNNTAKLWQLPDSLVEYTVPTTITDTTGTTYTVVEILDRVNTPDGLLESLTVESPENVRIDDEAFYNSHHLVSINDKDELFPEEWLFVSPICYFPIHDDNIHQIESLEISQPVEDATYDGDPMFSFGVVLAPGPLGKDDDTFMYYTGQSSTATVYINNKSNVDMSDRVVRIYFQFTGEDYNLGNYSVGNYTVVNSSTGSEYPLKVIQTDVEGIYYYDISGVGPGDTVSIRNAFQYTNPNSAGGDLRIWAEAMSTEDSTTYNGRVKTYQDYIMATWTTLPQDFEVIKNGSYVTNYKFDSDGSGNNEYYIANLTFSVNTRPEGTPLVTNEGKDYVQYIEYSDVLQLPEGAEWSEEILNIIRNRDYRKVNLGSGYINNVIQTNRYAIQYYKDGTWNDIVVFGIPSSNIYNNKYDLEVQNIDGKDTVVVKYSLYNASWDRARDNSPTSEIASQTTYLGYGNRVIKINRDSELYRALSETTDYTDEEFMEMRKISNKIDQTVYYTNSSPRVDSDTTDVYTIDVPEGFTMTKVADKDATTYFGQPFPYTIGIRNDGIRIRDNIGSIKDDIHSNLYIKAEDMYGMFSDDNFGDLLTLTISKAILCALPSSDSYIDIYGNYVDPFTAQQLGVEPIPRGSVSSDASELYTNAKIVIKRAGDGYSIEVDYTSDGIVDTSIITEDIGQYLNSIGYVVTSGASYSVDWDFHDEVLNGGEQVYFRIPTRVKDTHMLLNADHVTSYGSSITLYRNTAYAYDDNGANLKSASNANQRTAYRELYVYKGVDNLNVQNGSVNRHYVQVQNQYTGVHDIIPVSDRMTGANILIVPVSDNRNATYNGTSLYSAGLDTISYNNELYYILSEPGTYKGLYIDGKDIDTVTVSEMSNGGLETMQYFYYSDFSGSKYYYYYTLMDVVRAGVLQELPTGGTNLSYSQNNTAWVGRHQRHRIYASYGYTGTIMSFVKWISSGKGEGETLSTHSFITNGNEVLYKIILKNYSSDYSITVNGNQIYDLLPETYNCFEWSKDNVLSIEYVTENLGSSIETTGDEYWSIVKSSNRYKIQWSNDFSFNLDPSGEIWFYIKVRFPSVEDVDDEGNPSNEWDNYIATVKTNVYNDFYLGGLYSEVSHELADVARGFLQKGVVDTGATYGSTFRSNGDRSFYTNGINDQNSSRKALVSYYTVMYNSGNARLYLDDFYDVLPKGFYFNRMTNYYSSNLKTSDTASISNTSSANSYNYTGYYGYADKGVYDYTLSNTSTNSLANITDSKYPNVNWVYGTVTPSMSTDSEGRQHIRFSISRAGTSSSYIKYDNEVGRYYLEPGQGLRFGYDVYVADYDSTDEVANNQICMPIYDKYGFGVELDQRPGVNVVQARNMDPNDGGRNIISTSSASAYYKHSTPSWVNNDTVWFSSDVNVARTNFTPGIQKSVGGVTAIPNGTEITKATILGSKFDSYGSSYDSSVTISDVINWRIKVFNEVDGVGSGYDDYYVIDKVNAPYQFTGSVFYRIRNNAGSVIGGNGTTIFQIGGRFENDTSVNLYRGSNTSSLTTLTVNGPPVEFSTTSGDHSTVQLLRDEDGNETLIIHFKHYNYNIPQSSYLDLCLHTYYGSQMAPLSQAYYNNVILQPAKEYDPSIVSNGKVVYDDNNELVGIESGASVQMANGFSTAARKHVTEVNYPSNNASSENAKNYIILTRKDSVFRYDNYIDLPEEDPVSELVVIDYLPEIGDHSAFIDRDLRDSEFNVKLNAEDLGLVVSTISGLGSGTKTDLTYDKYSFEVSTKTSFVNEDWTSEYNTGWYEISDINNLTEADIEALNNAKSFRVIIHDDDLVIMPSSTQVKISYNAKARNLIDLQPSMIAWNTFGYSYSVPVGSTHVTLSAEPLKVGVQVPAVPFVKKNLVNQNNSNSIAEEQESFGFIVYSGSAISSLNDPTRYTDAEIYNILSTNSRKILYLPITVEQGTYTNQTPLLESGNQWVYDGELGWVETETKWIWEANKQYTLLEIDIPEDYNLKSIVRQNSNNYTFTQNQTRNIQLTVSNVDNRVGKLKLTKQITNDNPDTSREFTFKIQLKDGNKNVNGTFNYTGIGVHNGSITFANGIGVVMLKHNQSIVINDIPIYYQYTITEEPDDKYTCTYEGNIGTIEENVTKEVLAKNKFNGYPLTIRKLVTGNMGNKVEEFTFTIDTGKADFNKVVQSDKGDVTFTNGIATITLAHNESITLDEMPENANYIITENSGNYTVSTVITQDDTSVTDLNSAQNIVEFNFNKLTDVQFTNNLNIAVPTSIKDNNVLLVVIFVVALLCVFIIFKKYKVVKKKG